MNDIKNTQLALKAIKQCKDKLDELGFKYCLNDVERDFSDQYKRLTCTHEFTRIEHNYDSHYDYEDTICTTCGKEINSKKV